MKKYEVEIDNEVYQVTVRPLSAEEAAQAPKPKAAPAPAPAAEPAPAATGDADIEVTSPMAGNIWKIEVTPGQSVSAGDTLVILEAMKMENEIVAPEDAVVEGIHVDLNQAVQMGQILVSLKKGA